MRKNVLWFLLSVSVLYAENFWMQMGLVEGMGMANSAGDVYNITYLQLESYGKTGCFDCFADIRINEFLGFRDIKRAAVQPASMQVYLNPRINLNEFSDRNLNLGPVKRWFLASRYKGRANYDLSGDFYSLGLATEWKIPLIDLFSLNFYKQFEYINYYKNNGWRDAMEDSGWLAEIYCYTGLKQIGEDLTLSYLGRLSYGFANQWAKDNYLQNVAGSENKVGTTDEFVMYNGFFWQAKKWALSTGFEFHIHWQYRDYANHDKLSLFFGLHRRF